MSAQCDVNSDVAEAASAVVNSESLRPVPVRLAKRGDAAYGMMLSRVLPDSGVSRLDVAAFNSSI